MDLEASTPLESLKVFEDLSYDSMFKSVNFELHIDYHRRVKEFVKAEEKKRAKIKKIIGFVLAASAVGVALAYKYKKIGF